MANHPFVLDDYATLEVDTAGGSMSTDTPVAGVQGVTIVPNVSIERLYTADSIKVEAQQQFEFQVDVSIEYALWEDQSVFLNEWMGGKGSSATSMTDTTNPEEFKLTSTFESVETSQQLDVTVEGITFEEFPIIDTEMGEFVSRDLSGVGTALPTAEASIP